MISKLSNTLMVALAAMALWACNSSGRVEGGAAIKDGFADKFFIGTAMNAREITGEDSAAVEVIKKHFNAIVAENCMKPGPIQPREGEFNWDLPDRMVAFGEANNMFITGHVLLWHSQAPRWLFTDSLGNAVSPEVLTQRMKDHIYTVVGRYKGKVKGWDVVNEALLDDGSYRKSRFYEILGEEFIPLAFQFAHEADPDAELYYNDYNEWYPGKVEAIVKLIRQLRERGLRIDAVGMQGHIGMDHPTIEEYENAIMAYGNAGVKVMVTELDMSILPFPDRNVGAEVSADFDYQAKLNPYTEGLPDSVSVAWNNRMGEFFDLLLKHADLVTRVTAWGTTDHTSWKNNWPVRGRTDYPLLIDRNYQPKPFLEKYAKK
ncbi:MAG TPA: endo-1,4-beta-xylanase [Prolixibacteraceae bacterium]|nr:endo-1,4-beta-xylanase [Prolixibacteraceae bacterium]HOG95523.1 endo-1,4-beta-xylanase [Prolixibacteraceae bacterium]HOY93392.1 endo-1,4-beta-xylanase [Prolixibacteraceae bacterium]HPI34971.1 endo-1,4-beta-xylanase [Prolixibacteraceae bacterium]HPY27606.1 endo-1,4-beta-xylanase [Prolixibacteraceae bacterium]